MIGIDDIFSIIPPAVMDAATKGVATAIGKTITETGIKLLGNTGEQLLDKAGNLTKAAQDLLFPISQKYVENYSKRHGILRVLGMDKPVSLDSVYTKVNFKADTIQAYLSLENQEQVFRKREFKDKERCPGLDVANEKQYLMVLGNPGTGKTTFLQKVGLEALKGKNKKGYKHSCIPVLLELRRFRAEEKIDLKKELMLAQIAYENFVENCLFFDGRTVSKQIEQALQEMLPDQKYIDGRVVLREIELQHGVIIERQENTYSFSHLTLQEYLTALHIFENEIDIKEIVSKYLLDSRWREVFLILAGLKKADNLLLAMAEKTHSLIDTPKLQDLLVWVEKVTDTSATDFQPVGKSALAYANALALNKFIDYAQESQKYQIYNKIEFTEIIAFLKKLKTKIPNENQPKETHQTFARNLIKFWLKAFHLTSDMVNLSKEEIDVLDNYFYANWLMVQCKNAAVRYSPETWQEIESRMLLPKKD